MNSSTGMKRATRRAVLMAEPLEGRRLLSTIPHVHAVNLEVHRGQVGVQRGESRHAFLMSAAAQTADAASGSTTSLGAPASVGHWVRPLGRGHGGFGGQMAVNPAIAATPTTATPTATTPAAGTATSTASPGIPGGPMGDSSWGGGHRGRMGDRGQFAMNGGAAAGSTGTAPTQAQMAAFKQLSTDMQAIHDKSTVTPVMEAAARKDFEAIHKDATTAPDATKLAALQADLKATAGTIPTDAQKAQAVADFKAVVASEGVTDTALIDKTLADVDTIVAASNVNADDLAKLAADRTAAGLTADSGGAIGHGHDMGLGLLGGLTPGRHGGFGGGFRGDRFGMPPGGMMTPPTAPPATTPVATTNAATTTSA